MHAFMHVELMQKPSFQQAISDLHNRGHLTIYSKLGLR